MLVVRRSPRLNPASSAVVTVSASTKEEARAMYRTQKKQKLPVTEKYKDECVAKIRSYLNDVEISSGRNAKAAVATVLVKYLIQNPIFIATYDRFGNTLIRKMRECHEEHIYDPNIRETFRAAIEDLLCIIT
jgi:hypothetical protein